MFAAKITIRSHDIQRLPIEAIPDTTSYSPGRDDPQKQVCSVFWPGLLGDPVGRAKGPVAPEAQSQNSRFRKKVYFEEKNLKHTWKQFQKTPLVPGMALCQAVQADASITQAR